MRSTARSVANVEFHHAGERVNRAAHAIVSALERLGIRALNPSYGFPMEMDNFPEKTWVVSHKPVAVAAGMGRMGIHRNVIHPVFGSFIILGTVLVEAEATSCDLQVDFNPCLECKLCVAACPTGAFSPDGRFNFSACYSHNYREFMGGFTNWIEQVADSRSARAYRKKVTYPETVSMWQSLSYGANYKAVYCLAVCPAGSDVIGPYLADKPGFLRTIVKPLQEKAETVYVTAGSDAESYVARRFPAKKAKRVGNGLRPRSIRGFLVGLPLAFQRDPSRGLNVTYHFIFTGAEECLATVVIRDGDVQVSAGRIGSAGLCVIANNRWWLGFLAKEKSLIWGLLQRKIRISGAPRLLLTFGRCFPS